MSASSALLQPLRLVWRVPRARLGLAFMTVFSLVAIVGPWFAGDANALVGMPLQSPSFQHWLGTSGQGQDVLAQTLLGTRRSLAIGFGVGISVVIIGAFVGVISATVSGPLDTVLSAIQNS